jgi:hypothetical protein
MTDQLIAILLDASTNSKRETSMGSANFAKWLGCASLSLWLALPLLAQGDGAKAELSAGSGSITINYGQPVLGGRDRVAEQKVGDFWRMGRNQAAVLTSPVDLTFESTKVPKGSYSLWLLREAPEKYLLVFNSQTGQWGTQHDPSKDAFKVPLKQEKISSSVEVFTIELKKAAGGGQFSLSWGTTKLMADFQFAQ